MPVKHNENIFLIGFMGAGKSSFGKRLAKKINFQFLDLDRLIQQEEGMTIPEIFEQKGEVYFRECEQRWLMNYAGTKQVIALGGGTPCFYQNMTLINQKGISVYISCTADVLANRLKNAKAIRPLIERIKNDPQKLTAYISTKLTEREVFYTQATFTIDGKNIGANRMDEIATILSEKA